MEAAQAAPAVVSKGEFAGLIRVTPGRVSQYISEGKLTGEALVGDGRGQKVNVAEALAQLRRRIDPGQRYGNGATTRLSLEVADDPTPAPASRQRAAADDFEEEMRGEKLREIRFRNRDAAEKEMARRGQYVRADEVRGHLGALATAMMMVFEGGLSDLATAVSAKFELPQRDVLHLLRQEFLTLRGKAADTARRRAEALPALVADETGAPDEAEGG